MSDALGDSLIHAVSSGDNEWARQILASRPNINYNYRGYTPLDVAVDTGNLYLVILLRSRGADKMMPIRNPELFNGSKNAVEHAVRMAEMYSENDEVLAIAFFLSEPGTLNGVKFEKKLAALAKDPSYHFTSENAKLIAHGITERRDFIDSILRKTEEREKAKVRGLKGKVMSELRAIPGGPDYEAAKARFQGRGRRYRSLRKNRKRVRKTKKRRYVQTMFSTSLTKARASYQKELQARAKMPDYPFEDPEDKEHALEAMRRQDVLDAVVPAAQKRSNVLEKRDLVRVLQGRYEGQVVPHEIADKIASMATGVEATRKKAGRRYRSTRGRRVHKKRGTHKRHGRK